MKASLASGLAALAMSLLVACADDDPQMPPPIAPTTVQNNTYNNNVTYMYNTYNAPPPLSSDAAVVSAPAPTPSSAPPEAASPIVSLSRPATVNGTTRDLRSTGIAACDAYLDRVESCSRALLSSSSDAERGFQRIQVSLDMTRRAWRNAAENQSARDELARTCADARAMYESSVEDQCP